jgi:hypothetical protein
MPEFSYEFSWSEIINGVIGSFVFAALASIAVLTRRTMLKYSLAGRRARRRANYITIWKRVKSDAFFASGQKTEIVLGVIAFSLMILTIQLYMIEAGDGEIEGGAASVILFALFGACLSFTALMRENGCNEKAVELRSRIERRRERRCCKRDLGPVTPP